MAKILQTPSIIKFLPVDPKYAFDIVFQYSDNQSIKNRAVITDTETYEIVYDSTQLGMKLSHTVPSNTLTAGKRYVAQIQVFDEDGNSSQLSDQMPFYCFTTPSFKITNITNNSVIKNASVSPILEYSQNEGEALDNFQFQLYDQSKVLVNNSPIYYSLDTTSYTFYSLENNAVYYIRAIGETTHGIILGTDYIQVTMRYVQIPANAIFSAENIYNKGYINIQSNISDVGFEDKNCMLKDGTLTIKGGYLWYNEGFELNDDFYIILDISQLPIGEFFKATDDTFTINFLEISGMYYFWLKSGSYNLFKELEQVSQIDTINYSLVNEGYSLYLEVLCENGIYDMRITYKKEVSE